MMLENIGTGLIVPDSDAQIEEELAKIRKSLERIGEIQKARRIPLNPLTPKFPNPYYPHVPMDPYTLPYPVNPFSTPYTTPNGEKFTQGSCYKCGMSFLGASGYCCSRSDCPTGVSSSATK